MSVSKKQLEKGIMELHQVSEQSNVCDKDLPRFDPILSDPVLVRSCQFATEELFLNFLKTDKGETVLCELVKHLAALQYILR